MGNFAVHVEAVGGHGCQREIGDGQPVTVCGQPSCPDCITRRYVADLIRHGSMVSAASLTHWPGQPSQVRDDLLSTIREGSF